MWTSILSIALVINELMASNAGSVMSPAYNFDSWIELYNPTEQTINLAGMYLSDDANNLTRWKMPNNVGSVPAKGFLVVWLGSDDIRSNQAPFKLDCDGGTICLSDKNEQLITSMEYPEAMSRTAYARTTDGGNQWGWTSTPTPGYSNRTSVFATKRLDAPVVSEGSQLINGSLTFKVDIPEDTKLMYTTDCSMPTVPQVNNTNGNNNSQESKDGLFTVTKTTNYVFRLFRDGYLPSIPVTRSFIQTNNQYTIPVISIVGDERYFTDSMWGIDVKGTNGITGNGSDTPVNWNQPWDRPVNFSYISPTDGMLFNQDVNISISGGWTRMSSPRSIKLKSNKVFDGINHLDYVFFPQKPYIRSKTLLVRNGGNDVNNGSRFMDPALSTIILRSGIDVDIQSFVQVAEYVNGRFKGILNLREPNNEKFVYANFGYDDEEIDLFENSEFKNGTTEVYNHLVELSEHVGDTGVYDEIKNLLDIDEFANYMAIELFLGNDDWPNNNVKAYRSQKDGRYRFICFDLDYTFNAWNHTISSLNDYSWVKMVKLFKNLLGYEDFRKKFIDTFCIVAGSVFEKNRATIIVDELADAMRPMSQYDGKLPDNSANKIKNKLKTRLDEAISQLQQYKPMQLSGVKNQTVKLGTDTQGATILINGIKVPYADFNGKLFAPVLIEAKAPAGYRFTGWQKLSGSLTQIIYNNDTWRYYDNGEAATDWQSTNFNDNSWKVGTAPLGYKMDGVKTVIGYGTNSQKKNPTSYFRKTFILDATPKSTDVFQLNFQVDDGCVIYVNGQEAGRVNMRNGTVTYETFTNTYAGDVPLSGTLNISPSLFRKGNNLIAVEVHNTSYTSSDLFWSCELFTTVGVDNTQSVIADPVIDLPNDNNVSLVACFAPLTDTERNVQGFTPVRINEVSAANDIYVNEYFKRNDWIELYNTTSNDIDVQGMYLSDNPEKPQKFQINKTEGVSTIIPPYGYLIVWCDKLEALSQLHASFKLAAEGGDVLLTAADQSWSDHIVYTAMNGDETIGRYPDGSSNVITMNVPTIAKTNIMSSYADIIHQPETVGIKDLMVQEAQTLQRTYNLRGQAVQGILEPGIYIRNGRKIIIR